MKKYWSILSFVILAACVNSCETGTAPSSPAKRLTIEQIQKNPGYAWFDTERSKYTPNVDSIAEVKTLFISDVHKIYVHVNPSCGCEGTQQLFPHFMRVVQDAAIPEANYFIYSMAHASDEHPETSQFTITRLPSIFITKNDVLVATISEIILGKTVEQQVLEALRK